MVYFLLDSSVKPLILLRTDNRSWVIQRARIGPVGATAENAAPEHLGIDRMTCSPISSFMW
jgi:hypothetical protein